jgi:hypothetical protein
MDDDDKKIDDQGDPDEADGAFPHRQSLPQAAAKARQTPKKAKVIAI